MRRWILILSMSLLAAGAARGADEPATAGRLVTVTATALTEAQPDTMRLSIALASREGASAGQALPARIKSLSLATTRALQLMQGVGISSATARMTEINLNPGKEGGLGRTISWPPVPMQQAQQAREKVGSEFTLLALPASTKADALTAQARLKALRKAHDKAEDMAAALNAKLSVVWSITELPEAERTGQEYATPGMLQFYANVRVSFALE